MTAGKVGILFPNGFVSKLLATKLLQTNYNVVLYCPEEEDFKLAGGMMDELSILASDMDSTVLPQQETRRGFGNSFFSVQTGEDFGDFDFLVLGTMDILGSKSDKEYSTMLENHFQEMKKRGFQTGRETKIIFGGNHSGVIAGTVWGGLWPEMQQNILVGSSLYDASTKVFGSDPESRALPLDRHGDVFFSSKVDSKIERMARAVDIDDYSTLEAKLLQQIISLIGRGDQLEEIEVVGKFPDRQEAAKFKIPEGTVSWIPQIELAWWPKYCDEKAKSQS